MTTVQTEAWQRGPVPGFEPLLMPVVHALIQAREDLERLIPPSLPTMSGVVPAVPPRSAFTCGTPAARSIAS